MATLATNSKKAFYKDIKRVKQAFTEATGDVKAAVNHSLSQAKKKTTQLQHKIGDTVADKPYQSLGIAVLSGLCLGYIMRMKGGKRYRNGKI